MDPTDDLLVVRLMEVVVHADDLAVSVGMPTPSWPPAQAAATVKPPRTRSA